MKPKTAGEIMTREVVTATPYTSIVDVARKLLELRVNAMPVMDEDRLVGIISEADLVHREQRLHLPTLITVLDAVFALGGDRIEAEIARKSAEVVRDVMTHEVVTVGPSATIEEMATVMAERRIHTLPVLDDGRLVGIIGRADILTALYT